MPELVQPSALDIRFSISIMFSIPPSSPMWIEETRDGSAVLTVISEGDTHVANVVFGDSVSSKSTILFVHWEAGNI
jgi:hypothetical protein